MPATLPRYHLLPLIALLLGMLVASTTHANCLADYRRYYGDTEQTLKLGLKAAEDRFLRLAEQSLVYRTNTIIAGRQLLKKVATEQPLSGDDLDEIREGTLAHLQHRKALLDLATRHECWIDHPKLVNATPLNEQQRIRGITFSLASALTLYDNYLLAVSLFQNNTPLRRRLNADDSGYQLKDDQLKSITESYESVGKRRRVRRAIDFVESNIQRIRQQSAFDTTTSYALGLIEQSPSYRRIRDEDLSDRLRAKIGLLFSNLRDKIYDTHSTGTDLFSGLFGNTLGLIELRKGKLLGRSDVYNDVASRLQPGDILVEKTPFRLTDKLIPGHWGHVAVWAGSEQQLRKLGLWQHPQIKRYHSAIENNQSIVEALRNGVVISRLEHFLNIDDLAILRPTFSTPESQKQTLVRLFRQLGKPYDFNFDVESSDKIVCSELVYQSFQGYHWPTEKTLGRFTISPDNVASLSLNSGPLKLVRLYHDGHQITQQPQALMAKLVSGGLPTMHSSRDQR